MEKQAYSARETAEMLGVSERLIRGLIATAEIKSITIARRRLVTRDEIDRVLGTVKRG